MKFIKEEMEDKGLTEMAEMKRAQLQEGIQAAYDEMAKLYNCFFTSPWVFTGFHCPKRGPTILRVVLKILKEQNVDLDAVRPTMM